MNNFIIFTSHVLSYTLIYPLATLASVKMTCPTKASNQIALDKQHENNMSVSIVFLEQSTMNFCINNSILIQYLLGIL